MEQMEREAIRLGALIRASEDWSTEYTKDPKTHGTLMRLESKWELALKKYFHGIAQQDSSFINWSQYVGQLKADYNIEVLINDYQLDNNTQEFIQISLEIVTEIIATGAIAGQNIYQIPLNITSTDANIQRLGLEQVAGLVGKKVDKAGNVVDNPNPKYNVLDTVRKDILQSIKTSLALGEDLQAATERVNKVIDNPARSEKIARTESVNAYQSGLHQFAVDSKAVGKEWQDVGAIDECATYSQIGPVPVNYIYGDGLLQPTAHVRCRCGMRYIYQTEWNSLGFK